MRCKNPQVEKANKFVFGILDKMLLKCPLCQEGGLSYQKFLLHYDCCIIANKYGTIQELTKLEKEKDEIKKGFVFYKTLINSYLRNNLFFWNVLQGFYQEIPERLYAFDEQHFVG